jgi:hypothetical protein
MCESAASAALQPYHVGAGPRTNVNVLRKVPLVIKLRPVPRLGEHGRIREGHTGNEGKRAQHFEFEHCDCSAWAAAGHNASSMCCSLFGCTSRLADCLVSGVYLDL